MKNLIKTLITTILVAAIVVTGISVDTTTATAKTTKTGTFQNGGTITLKLGDTMKLFVKEDGKDATALYKWTSSDTNIVRIETDFYDSSIDYTECVILGADTTGTVTITGKYRYKSSAFSGTTVYDPDKPDLTMTVTVKQTKMTAKQKKCKHKYKTTKKATCQRTGIKTCKKCKWQKTIKKTGHKWVNETVTSYEYTKETIMAVCNGCYCPEVPYGYGCSTWHNDTNTICTSPCDKVWYGIEYNNDKDAMDKAILEHLNNDGCRGDYYNVDWSVVPYGPLKETTKKVTVCKYCSKEKPQ